MQSWLQREADSVLAVLAHAGQTVRAKLCPYSDIESVLTSPPPKTVRMRCSVSLPGDGNVEPVLSVVAPAGQPVVGQNGLTLHRARALALG
jgi:hypothetical protein